MITASQGSGTVSTIRTLLLEREWAKETGEGIQLTQPQKLLEDWGAVWARRRERAHTFERHGVAEEVEKMVWAIRWGADTVMDL